LQICCALAIDIASTDGAEAFGNYADKFSKHLQGGDCSKHVILLVEALKELADDTNSSPSAALGNAYVQAALFTWQLYIPNIPIDPAVASHAEFAFHDHLRLRQLDRVVVAEDSLSLPGGRGARYFEDLAHRLVELDERLSHATSSHIDRPAQASIIPSLFLELQQCATSLLNIKRMVELIEALNACQETALVQVRNLQEALRSVSSRLDALYELDYSDILRPVLLVFAALNIGLDLLHYDSQKRMHVDKVAKQEFLVQTLAQFPFSLGAHRALAAAEREHPLTAYWLVSPGDKCLLGLYIHVQAREWPFTWTGSSAAHEAIRGITDLYQRIHNMWEADQRKAAEEKAAAESIYRSRKEELIMPSEDEIEAEELSALFPLDDGLNENGTYSSVKQQAGPAGVTPPSISQTHMTRLYYLHLRLFGDSGSAQVSRHRTFE
jgi:midasin